MKIIIFTKKLFSGPKRFLQFLEHIRRGVDSLLVINQNINQVKNLLTLIAYNTAFLGKNKYKDNRCLTNQPSQVYSQNNEDGILAEIFNRIGIKSHFFVEIGVDDGLQNNSRFLLENQWHGLWIEGNHLNVSKIKKYFSREIRNKKLRVIEQHVTKENINDLLKAANVPKEFDLLSIDIDMNTHHIWDQICEYSPRVACIEYNASIPPSVNFSIPYEPDATWDFSNRFGAGLKALELIGSKKGYNLVGCDSNGVNAFFVKNDLVDEKFLPPFTAEHHYEPARYNTLIHHKGHFPYIPKIN